MAIIFRKELVDGIFTVADNDAFNNVKLVANKEGLLVGSSSGAALQGALELKKHSNWCDCYHLSRWERSIHVQTNIQL